MASVTVRISVLVVCLSAFAGSVAKECISKIESNKTRGELYSLNFPKTFPSDYCVRWYIRGQPGSVITISFSTISLPTDPFADNYNCSHNFIKIGPSPERTICGYTAEPYIKKFDSLRPFVWINFESGPNPRGRGFRLQYVIGPEPAEECPDDQFQCDSGKCVLRQWCQNGQNECGDYSDEQPLCIPLTRDGMGMTALTTPLPTTPKPSTAVNDIPTGCYHELHSPQGNFSEVLFARYLYQETTDCSWLIQTSSDLYHVELRFYNMRIPRGRRVEVFDGPTPEFDRLGKYGQDSDSYQSVRSSGRSLLVMFRGTNVYQSWYDYGYKRVVFEAVYHFARNPTPASACFHHFVGSQGNFSMPPEPLYRVVDIQNCTWLIQSPDPNTRIRLTFREFDLRGGETVEVFDGDSERRPTLAKFKTVSDTVHSSGHFMLVKFIAGDFKPQASSWIVFAASFKAEGKEEMCVEPEYSRCGVEDNFACYHANQSCDGVWDCPLSGKDENGCFGCSHGSFSCGEFGGHRTCFFLHDRCSGTSACENNFDEENCNEELCSESHGKFLCDNKRCILEGWLCDMTDDCGDNSDENGCRMGSSRKVIIAAVVGSLVCSLLLVMALGCACKVYSLRHQPRRRSPRFDTPLSRLQAEMFRRRAPPPPYHEAMLTSRPYDEAVREYLERFPPPHSHQQSDGVSHDPGPDRGQDHETPHQTEIADTESDSVQNLINLMDFAEDGDSSRNNHPPTYIRSDPRLEIRRHRSDASSSSNSEDEEGDDYDLNEHSLAAGHMEMETSITAEPNTGNAREDIISEDSASATLSADGLETSDSKPEDKEKESSLEPGTSTSGDKKDDKKDEESDADSVCILCLDDPPFEDNDDDTSDTRCLLQDA